MSYDSGQDNPLRVLTPEGEVLAPVQVTVDAGVLVVLDRDGVVLRSSSGAGEVQGGRRRQRVTTEDGEWALSDLCGCSSGGAALRREWFGVPRTVGT